MAGLAGLARIKVADEQKRLWMDAICRLPVLRLANLLSGIEQVSELTGRAEAAGVAARHGPLTTRIDDATSTAMAMSAVTAAIATANANPIGVTAAVIADASSFAAANLIAIANATANAAAIAATRKAVAMSFEQDRAFIYRANDARSFLLRPLWATNAPGWSNVVELWKTALSDLGLSSFGDRYDRAMKEGIDLDEWIAWALDPPPPERFPTLPEAPADLALHVHRQILAGPARLGSLLAAVPTLSNDEATLKILATPESNLPQLQQHMQPSPLWMGWMETVQAGRVREVWDRVRLATEGAETPAKP